MGKKPSPSSLTHRNVASKDRQNDGGANTTTTTNHKKQRRSKKDNKKNSNQHNDNHAINLEDTNDKIETPWQTVRKHPTFWAFFLLVLPFGVPVIVNKVVTKAILQYPDTLNVALDFLESKLGYQYRHGKRFRSAITMDQPRQVLIIGSLSSGTSAVVDLQTKIGLEIGYQNADTTQSFVRDGTASWFHGIRFLDLSNKDVQSRAKMIVDLCAVSWRVYSSDKINFNNAWSNYGMSLLPLFGPTSVKFDVPHWHPSFRKSYLNTCHRTMLRELSCGINEISVEDKGDDVATTITKKCPTPFQRTLIQTRRPWDIVASLVTRYCGSSLSDKKNNTMAYKSAPTTLLKLFQALFPNINHTWFSDDNDDVHSKNSTIRDNVEEPVDTNLQVCTNQMASYVSLWYNSLLDSFDKISRQINKSKSYNAADFGVYPIESTTVCKVAELAGFVDGSNIYGPNAETVVKYCQRHSETLFRHSKHRFNTCNITVVEDDSKGGQRNATQLVPILLESKLRSVIDQNLERQLDELHARMGYKNDELHQS